MAFIPVNTVGSNECWVAGTHVDVMAYTNAVVHTAPGIRQDKDTLHHLLNMNIIDRLIDSRNTQFRRNCQHRWQVLTFRYEESEVECSRCGTKGAVVEDEETGRLELHRDGRKPAPWRFTS